MTRADYILLSSALADAHAQISSTPYIENQLSAMAGHRIICERLANVLAENPFFNREKFLSACVSQRA